MIVFERLGDGFAYRLQTREVDNAVRTLGGKYRFQRIAVEKVDAIKREILSGYLFDAFQRRGL